MNIAGIRSNLTVDSAACLVDIQLVDKTDSTNDDAMRQIQAGKNGCWLLIAKSQTAGKGRRGRSWYSAVGTGIYFSLVRPFKLEPQALQGLSLVTALSVADALKSHTLEAVQLKWPNDLLVNKRKLAGILLELKRGILGNTLVFGIGLNVAIPAEAQQIIDQPVTDLTNICWDDPKLNEIIAAIVNNLLSNLVYFERHGFKKFQADWNRLDCYRNRAIVVQNGDKKTLGKSLGVDKDGALLVQTATGIEVISGGEIFPSVREAIADNQI